MAEKKLMEIRDLRMYFPVGRSIFSRRQKELKAVDGVSFDIPQGKTG